MPDTAPRPVVAAPAPRPAAGTEVLGPMSGSGYRTPPTLVRRGDGQMVQLSPLLAALLSAIDGERGPEEIADEVEAHHGRSVHPDDVAALLTAKLVPLGLVELGGGPAPELRRSDPLLGLRGRIQLAGPERTEALARPFRWLFRPAVVGVVLTTFAAFSAWVVLRHGLGTAIDDAIADPMLLLGVIALVLASGAFHELGHAAACSYGGARPRAMGAAVYLVWPAFYTDVTDSYRLDRRGRLRVDLGGLYFNAVFTVATGAAWLATGTEALLVLVPVQLLQMARQLVPIVRFDGYHILADLVGVPDLFARIRPTIARALPGRRVEGPNPLTPRAQAVVVTWVAVVVPFLLGSLGLLLWNLPGIVTELAALPAGPVGAVRRQPVDRAGRRRHPRRRRHGHRGLPAGQRGVPDHPHRPPLRDPLLAGDRGPPRRARREPRPRRHRAGRRRGADLRPARPCAGRPGRERGRRGGHRARRRPGSQHADSPIRPRPPRRPASPSPAPAPQTAPAPAPGSTTQPVAVAVASEPVTSEVVRPLATVRSAWPFSFPRPGLPGPGGNQAMAVGTVDGATQVALATSLHWLEDQPMRNRNEAYAFAQCLDCRTVAAAFQIVAASGRVATAIPENIAVSVNERCDRCVTGAVAVQLAVTLVEQPPQQVKAQVNRIVQRVNGLRGQLRNGSLDEVLAELESARSEALALLDPWIVDAADQVEDDEPVPEEADSPSDALGAPEDEPADEPASTPAPDPGTMDDVDVTAEEGDATGGASDPEPAPEEGGTDDADAAAVDEAPPAEPDEPVATEDGSNTDATSVEEGDPGTDATIAEG